MVVPKLKVDGRVIFRLWREKVKSNLKKKMFLFETTTTWNHTVLKSKLIGDLARVF